jgi:hypothetical protein
MAKKLLTDEDAIYAAVGRALTTWGAVEDALGKVYCAAVNPRNFNPPERAYWSIVSFEGRIKMTGKAVEERELGLPLLKDWTPLSETLLSQNKIRNKLAHGSVIDVTRRKNLLSAPKWALAPYYYARRWPELSEQYRIARPKLLANGDTLIPIDGRPKERLNHKQLVTITGDFEALEKRVEEFYLVVERLACTQEGVPLADNPKDQRLLSILSTQRLIKTVPPAGL